MVLFLQAVLFLAEEPKSNPIVAAVAAAARANPAEACAGTVLGTQAVPGTSTGTQTVTVDLLATEILKVRVYDSGSPGFVPTGVRSCFSRFYSRRRRPA